MQTLLLVAAGGATGAVARYLLGVQAMRSLGGGWPYGTFAANILGGLLMGLLAGVLAMRGGADHEKWRLLLGV
ncbi:CrcB family protein, partial [Phenylobacterium sp.]|uniref:CrcB family protein n=1 Tax=Phenylobacterium sp. TaxID=1871053 RepID=UPI0025F54FCF